MPSKTRLKLIKEIRDYLIADEEEYGIDPCYDTDTDKGYANTMLQKAWGELTHLHNQLCRPNSSTLQSSQSRPDSSSQS
jgi:hypothetical protein